MRKTLEHWTRQVSELKGGLLGRPSKTIKDSDHESDRDYDIWLKRFQIGIILVNDLETVLAYFGEYCGCFMPLSQKFCPSLNWKALDEWHWHGRGQDSLILTVLNEKHSWKGRIGQWCEIIYFLKKWNKKCENQVSNLIAHIIEKGFSKGIWDLFPRGIDADFYYLERQKAPSLQLIKVKKKEERKKK